MSSLKLKLLSVLVLGACAADSVVSAATAEERWVPGRLLVQPRAGLSDVELGKVLKTHGGKSVGKIPKINVHIVQLPANVSEKAVAALISKNPHIKFAERDMFVAPTATANDPYFASEWHLSTISAQTAWDISNGQGVTIAILDSGIDVSHPDLAGNLVSGWNVYGNNSDLTDVTGHGTKVAGAAAAISNNSLGVAGVAGAAKIMPIRIADSSGYALFSNMATALTWAADHGAKVANISYDSLSGSSTVISAANYLKSKGGLTVVSAGNSGTEQTYAPSDALIVVSATDSNDVMAGWSSYGNFVDLSAPGVGIYTTAAGGSYASVSGTSFSSPITSGTVALMMAANPNLAPATVQSLLLSTATDLGTVGWDKYYGNGRLNAAAAVSAARNSVAADTTKPSVAFVSPSVGTVLKGVATVDVSASDNVGVSRVDLVLNGTTIASDIASPYRFSWDTSTVADGSYTLNAYAYDAAGNYAASSVGVNVVNTADTIAPTVNIVNPSNGSNVTGTPTISVMGGDNVVVSSVKLYIDGALVTSSSTATVSYKWNTRKVSKGSHAIKAVVTDQAGNASEQAISVVVY